MTAETSIVSGLAGRYATALFELARDQKQIDAVLGGLEQLDAMISGSPDFARMIRSPVLARHEQEKAVAAVLAKAAITGLTANFVGITARNRRLFLLPAMIAQFRVLVSAHKGEVAAEVTAAKPLSAAQLTALRASLAKVVGRDVRLTAKVDPAILGGLVVRVGSRMVDSSLKTKLNNLRSAMKEVA